MKMRYFKNGFCLGGGFERWNCAETGRRITFRLYFGKWILTWDCNDFFKSDVTGDSCGD